MTAQRIEGKCHCGKVSYSCDGPPRFEFLCHCEDCQRLFAGGRLTGAIVSRDGLTADGEISIYSYPGGSGENLHSHFCKACGTSLYALSDAHQDIAILRANTIVKGAEFAPKKSLFEEAAPKWESIIGGS